MCKNLRSVHSLYPDYMYDKSKVSVCVKGDCGWLITATVHVYVTEVTFALSRHVARSQPHASCAIVSDQSRTTAVFLEVTSLSTGMDA